MKKIISKVKAKAKVAKPKAVEEVLCTMCKGTGRDKPESTCPACKGTGK